MKIFRPHVLVLTCGLVALALLAFPALSQEFRGTVKSTSPSTKHLVVISDATHKDVGVSVLPETAVTDAKGHAISLGELKNGTRVIVEPAHIAASIDVDKKSEEAGRRTVVEEFFYNFRHNLFKPLLLFFYMGFLVPIFRVKFEFPYVIYQALTIYLLIAIGWHGGEELAGLDPRVLGSVLGFMVVGFLTNFVIGVLAYILLKTFTRLRQIDKATVAGYYGSDSAGTFVTCLGVLAAIHIKFDAYMPVMLAVMEIPGCLVALYLVSRLRNKGMDPRGNMPNEPGYDPNALPPMMELGAGGHGGHGGVEAEKKMSLEMMEDNGAGYGDVKKGGSGFNLQLLHEVFFNPGLYLLFGGIVIGYISGLQGSEVTRADDSFFVTLFQGILCLFLLEMGMTASRKLMDLKSAGIGYILFGLLAPNLFAVIGILVAHTYSWATHTPLELGSYVLFAVLCAAASYIAVPAVQRLAIPEASPTLPLAASLGLTFSYNVTIGIPIYIELAKYVIKVWPA